MDGAPPDNAARVANAARPTHARNYGRFVREHCEIGAPPLVPAIRLHFAVDARGIFSAADTFVAGGVGCRPYWAFAWPGGQGLARYIADNPALVAGKHVLDVGAGSGIGAIAALKAGARTALAADIDPLAITAAGLNADANGVALATTTADLLATDPDADVILVGDLVYEPELQIRVGAFIAAAAKRGIPILYGDRTSARRPRLDFRQLAEYEAPLIPALVDDFIERARVWRLG